MKIRVKLFGTLSYDHPCYRPGKGLEIDIPPNAKVDDLLGHLKIAESQGIVVTINGRIMKSDDTLQSGADVHVFQSVFGG